MFNLLALPWVLLGLLELLGFPVGLLALLDFLDLLGFLDLLYLLDLVGWFAHLLGLLTSLCLVASQ